MISKLQKMNSNSRNFIKTSSLLLGSRLVSYPFTAFSKSKKDYTVGEIMDLFITQIPNVPFTSTVNTLKSGIKDQII